jgi:hypothetical protein
MMGGPSALTVVFHQNLAPIEERPQFAFEVAKFVRDHYRAYPELNEIDVSFEQTSSTGPITAVRSNVVYRFKRPQLGEPLTAPTSP